MSEKLVDYLAQDCNLYVSDLRRPEKFPAILPIVIDISPSRFSAEDWSESLTYLFGKRLRFEDSEDAKNYCIKVLAGVQDYRIKPDF